MDDAVNLLHLLLDSSDGVASYRQLIDAGVSRRALRAACANGSVALAAPGIYVHTDRDPRVLRAAVLHGRLTCTAGAEKLGLWVLHRDPLPHIACARPRTSSAAVIHRARSRASVESLHPWTAPVLDVVAHALRCLPELDALVILESAVNLGQIAREDIEPMFTGRRDARHRRTISLLDSGSESILETVARYHLQQAGMRVRTQARITGLGRVDLLVEERVGVELHGRRFHDTPVQFEEDLRRANVAALRGLPLLQYPGRLVLHAPERMVADVQRLLRGERVRRRTAIAGSRADQEG